MDEWLEWENRDAALRVDCARGGRIASLRVFGEELLVGASEDALAWGCYPLAPWAGRLRDRAFTFAGVRHRMPANFGAHAIHGTVFRRPWSRIAADAIATDLGPDWPFPGRVVQRFELGTDFLRVGLAIEAYAAPFPASAGFHPWFRRRLGRGGTAELSFSAAARCLCDAGGIPTGALGPVGQGPWDDCFVGVAPEPELRWPGVLRLALASAASHWVVYDRPAHALCVEPWTAPPDALNGAAALVAPGSPLELQMCLRWVPDRGSGSALQNSCAEIFF